MATGAPNYWAVVSWILAVRRATIKRAAADATQIISCIPCPDPYCMPALDLDFE